MKTIIAFLVVLLVFTAMAFSADEPANTTPTTTQTQPAQAQEEKVKIGLSGKIEISANYLKKENEASISGINALANFGLNLEFRDWINGKIGIEMEISKTYNNAVQILDETYIKIGNTDKFPLFLKIGKYKLPTQEAVSSIMFTDPLTLEIGEMNLPAIQLSAKISMFEFGIGVFKTSKTLNLQYASKHIHDGYAYLKFEPAFLQGMAASIGLISNILDGKFLSDGYDAYGAQISNRISGLSAGLTIPIWKIKLTGEFVSALKKVVWLGDTKPYSLFMELSINPIDILEAGIRFETSNKMEYKTKLGAIVRLIFGKFNVALEYIYGKTQADKNASSLTAVAKLEF